ncbi:hypothetical protein NPS01_39470 [Nocardioides psychrotolerans]|uniref:Uncharacterized protein n=1 Tax=Nocardioides psychrotolerans TaxID=1005945 RepID=A0A1I3QXV0_9ACTN|nr:hypothetical protein [Nocardioides psychrotolerans]GEP40284.1 hypothetical protein NPS01_39470 [Nocardioides psychrotolerans]SFJ37956.1 hypothetical protein SAMN05216561_1288 [Nocardioides psychrotolerans]
MSLVLLGLWLAAIGVGDLLRASHDVVTLRRLGACLGAAVAVLFLGLVLLAPGFARGLVLLVLLGAFVAAWLAASTWALDPRRSGRERDLARAGAFTALAIGALTATLGVQLIDSPLVWPDVVDRTITSRWPASDLVVALGVVAAQLVTANIVVRLLLDAVGVPATTNEKQLKGGRVLGPMERIFIVGLGSLGELTAAAIVVAAKGLLRFPSCSAPSSRACRSTGRATSPNTS